MVSIGKGKKRGLEETLAGTFSLVLGEGGGPVENKVKGGGRLGRLKQSRVAQPHLCPHVSSVQLQKTVEIVKVFLVAFAETWELDKGLWCGP